MYKHDLMQKDASSQQSKWVLSKAAEQVKSDGVVINTLTHAVLLQSYNDIYTYWFSLPGVLFEILSVIVIALVVVMIYVVKSIEEIMVALLILEEVCKPPAESKLAFDFMQIMTKSKMSQDLHLQILMSMRQDFICFRWFLQLV